MKVLIKIKVGILFAILAFIGVFNNAFALDKVSRLTVFTGTDFAWIVVDETFQQDSKNTFKAKIRSLKDDNILWSGEVNFTTVSDKSKKTLSFTISKLTPELWSPSNPFLNDILLEQYKKNEFVNTLTERLRFRSFESKAGNLFLNNKPIFLRGFAIGFSSIYPITYGFMPVNKSSLEKIAVLCNYGPGLEVIALAEQFNGNGSIILSGFDLVRRTGIDPIADRLMLNLIVYTASNTDHDIYPLITSTIVWGDYETEKGILTGINSGLMINSTPRIPE